MHQKEFDHVVQETMESIHKLLVIKGSEYAGSEDRLANFKRGANLTGVQPLTVLFIYLSKHYDAISTYIRNQQLGASHTLSEPIEGRLDDLINYCILAKAIIRESHRSSNSVETVRDIISDVSTGYPTIDRRKL